MSYWRQWAETELAAIRAAGRARSTIAYDGAGVRGRTQHGTVISFASNDYLGLTTHPHVRAAAAAAIEQWGSGSGASRLVTGTRSLHHELETAIASWKRTERALVFSSGYAANVGVLQSLGAEGATLFSDELNHASLIDGCRLAKARKLIYRHNDLEHLETQLAAADGPKIVVTEAVFSMDGDAAPLAELGELCVKHAALLVVDEAHSVLGPNVPDISDLECVRVGTLSKTLAALGGWAAGPAPLIELLINRARTFIFTTAPTPADMAAALAALGIYRGEEGAALRARLRAVIDMLRPGHVSAVVPIILGSEEASLAAARKLLDLGLYIPAIRPPTVAPGTSRLRVALSAAHTDEMMKRLKDGLRAYL